MSDLRDDTTLQVMDERVGDRLRRLVRGFRAPKGSGERRYARFLLMHLAGAPALSLLLSALVTAGLFVFGVGEAMRQDREIEVQVITPETVKLDQIKEDIQRIEEPNEPPPDVSLPVEAPVVGTAPVDVPGPQPVADIASVAPVMTKSPLILKGLAGTLVNRGGAARAGALRAYGGTGAGEDAVLRALRWLKDHQDEDGSWAKTDKTDPVAMAGLALLCFLAHNETPASPEFGLTVQKAMKYLVGRQAANGVFGREYTHGIATYAVSEGFALTRIMALKDAMDKGIDVIIKGQQPAGGFNYGYEKGNRWDLSVAGWQFQALKAARMAGCAQDGLDDAIKKGLQFLKNQAFAPTRGGFGYSGTPGIQGTEARPSMTGAGVLCMQLMGMPNAPEVRAGLEFLKETPCQWDSSEDKDGKGGEGRGRNQVYAWYYITQAKFQRGGTDWEAWNKLFSRQFLLGQQKDGHWENGEWSRGAVYTTTLCVLTLEVYYRYLPTYKHAEPAEEPKPASSDDVKVDVG